DKFTRSEFKIKVSTEAVVFSYEKGNRFAVGKIVDTNLPGGSVESTGGYYLNGKSIQQYQLTRNDGRAHINLYSKIEEYVQSGFYYVDSPTLPDPVGGYLLVESYDTRYVKQTYTPYNKNKTYLRVKNNTTWTPWVEYAKADHPNLINTGWQSAGYPGTYYKRVGDVLTIKYDFTGNGSTMNIGSIPSDIWVAPQSYMLVIAKWAISGSDNSHVQINQGTGAFNVLATGNGIVYRGQLTIMI
ncbi:hypothetical protein HPA30_06185, partial [Streptococcus suis]|nr:hypothetical protein [Streptococcus suis]